MPNYPYTVHSTNCVEIWSGGPLTVDSTGTHNGEVNADSGGGGNSGTGWIDLYAKGDISILGDSSGSGPFAVHATGWAAPAATVRRAGWSP